MLNTLRGDVYIAHCLCISSYKRKGSLDIEMHILMCPGEGFFRFSRGQPRKGNDTWLVKAPSLFPRGWAGQAVSEQECQVSESVSFGADRWKDNWGIKEITFPHRGTITSFTEQGCDFSHPNSDGAAHPLVTQRWSFFPLWSTSEEVFPYTQSKLPELLWHQCSHPFSVCRDMNKPSSPRFFTLGSWPRNPDK